MNLFYKAAIAGGASCALVAGAWQGAAVLIDNDAPRPPRPEPTKSWDDSRKPKNKISPSPTPGKKSPPKATKEPEPTRKQVPPKPPTVMGSFTVNYPTAPYRTINIKRAAELIDHTTVLPGETWSLNRSVGERTRERGFTEGVMIQKDRYVKDFGGGVSALATTVFNAAWFSGVDLVEHHPHSFYIERYPAGRESTVAWPSADVRFRNDTPRPITIRASATPASSTVTLFGTRKYSVGSAEGPRTNFTRPATHTSRDPHCEPQPPGPGFDVTVTRFLRKHGALVDREDFRTRYDPRDEVICTGSIP